jgi:glutathione S-transferase
LQPEPKSLIPGSGGSARNAVDNLKLYYAPGGSSLALLAALEEAGANYEAVRVSIEAGQQHSAAYRAISPAGRLPLLTVGDRRVGETIGILTAVANLFPDAALLPRDSPIENARAFERLSWLAATVEVSISQILETTRFTDDPAASAVLKADGRERVASHFRKIDAVLTGEWVLESHSVLDPYLLVFWRWGERLDLEMGGFERWAAHTRRVMARPAVAAAVAREQEATAELVPNKSP